MNKEEAYRIVYDDLMTNSLINGSAKGLKNINPHFRYGLSSVMESIWLRIGDNKPEDFDITFQRNLRG